MIGLLIMRDIQAAKYKHLVEIWNPGSERTPSGDFVEGTPTKFASRYASINGLSGRELVRARAVESEVTHLVAMRTDSVVSKSSPKMQVRFQDHRANKLRTFEILSIRDIEEAGRETEFLCKELVA